MKQLARQDYTKIIIAASSLIVAISVAYYLVIRPIQKDKPLNDCLATADGVLKMTNENINKRFDNGSINSSEKAIASFQATRDYSFSKDECYKKF